MKHLSCPKCSRVVDIEATYVTTAMVNNELKTFRVEHGHSTTKGSELQCACGQFLK
jgi:hypothetical protein